VFHIIKRVERVLKKFLSPMENTDGLFEIRVEYGSNIYRIFCCSDEGRIVVLFNAFQKMTQKTPQKEIEKALRLKREYFELKKTQENEKRSNKKR
jgi:phage-related protein